MPTAPVPPPVPRPLARRLGTAGVLFLTLSAATPASSVFVIVPGMLQAAGAGALWAMALAGLVCVATAFVYAELSSAWPIAGGEYVMVARTLGPLAGFVMLGVNLFNNLLFPPVVALGTSAVLAAALPGLPVLPVALAVMAFSTGVALLDIRANALVTGAFLAVELAALVAVSALGFMPPARPLGPLLLHPGAGPAAIGVATTIAIFALNGYGMAVYFGEEMTDAPRRIARVVLLALVLTLACEAVPLAAVLVGTADAGALRNATDPFGVLARARGGGGVAGWIALGVTVAIVNAAIVNVLACARFFYASGRDRTWGNPLDRLLTALHPRFESPWAATLLIGAVGSACCFLPLAFLLVLSGTGLVVIYAGVSLAALVGRRSGATTHAPYRMPLFPLAPLVALAALGYVAWTNWLDPDEGRSGLIATAAQMALAAGYYVLVVRRRGAWRTRDPA